MISRLRPTDSNEVGPTSAKYKIVYKRPKVNIALSSTPDSIVLSVPRTPVVEGRQGVDATSVMQKGKKMIAEKYAVLHVAEDGQELTYIVKDVDKNEFAICRQISAEKYRHYIKIRHRLSQFCNEDDEIGKRIWPDDMELFICGQSKKFYIIAPRHYGSLHAYVVDMKKLNETETRHYYCQILQMVAFCHERGLVVRDIKLRKFVFVDERRRQIRIDDLDELFVCESMGNDLMSDRNGSPAYVGPELLDLTTKNYSGKLADVWSLGVLLYVMLVGRYPFYDKTPNGLFEKIRSASVLINNQCGLTLELNWLIRCLLRKVPQERPNVHEVLARWFPVDQSAAAKSTYGRLNEETRLLQIIKDDYLPENNTVEMDQQVPCFEEAVALGRRQEVQANTDRLLE